MLWNGTKSGGKMARKNVEHNRLLLTYWMMRGGLNVMVAWKEAGKKIARSKAQLNIRKGVVSA